VLLALWAMLGALLVWAWHRGQPTPLPAAQSAATTTHQQALLPCVSYAPFRQPGQSPFDPTLVVSPAAIETDLRLLRSVTNCVRTYGLDHGLHAVPEVARKLGMRVVLGAWIGRDPLENASQMQRALALCQSHADVIAMLVVGNEVLLRREQTAEALADLLKQAQQATSIPIAYADVWEFWQRHAAVLLDHVDVVAAHILPYWEDEPVAVRDAAQHVLTIAATLRNEFAPKPIFVAETGWPAVGRQRGPSVPGAIEQTRFLRELITLEAQHPLLAKQSSQATQSLPFNVIEAFDQPWKRDLEGAMGGFWGMYTADGQQRLTLSGPVVADPSWWRVPMGALVGGMLGLGAALWAIARARRRDAPTMHVQALAVTGALIGATLPLHVQGMLDWNRNAVEWGSSGVMTLLMLVCSLAAGWRLAGSLRKGQALTQHETVTLGGVHAAWQTQGPNAKKAWAEHAPPRWVMASHAALLFLVACGALGLIFDARYRPLTAPLLIVPAALGLLLHTVGERWAVQAREERALAGILLVAAPVVLLQEGLVNGQAWGMAVQWVALAWPVLRTHHASADASSANVAVGRGVRTNTKAANNTAGALKPAE
jgi:exo-beta-1,3-glucanase (GH17 family)